MNKTKILLTTDLRKELKEVFSDEISKLPEYLKELPTKDKLNYLIKLMPFVFPKLETVTHENGEPGDWGYNK